MSRLVRGQSPKNGSYSQIDDRIAVLFVDGAVIATGAAGAERVSVVDYTERLRRLAMNDPAVAADVVDEIGTDPRELDPKTLTLVRLGALVAVGGAVPTFGQHADAALNAGATVDEIVAVLVGVEPIIGLPRVVAAAPRLALALGYDLEDAEEARQLG